MVAAQPSFRHLDDGWGLDFVHHTSASGRYYMVETNGGGLVAFDYDSDGDVDLFAIDGGPLPGAPDLGDGGPKSRLYRNDGGRFRDVTAIAGIAVQGYGSGGAAADIDGDGDLDLLVTAFGPNFLFRNQGDGTFEEVGRHAGIDDPGWGASAAFADTDRDGDLDLYVANYVDFSLDRNLPCGDQSRGLRGYCGPDVYRPQGDRFYRNRGDGTFEDATAVSGFEVSPGAGLAVVFADFDGDDWPDLYVANDLTPNFLFKNLGDGRFEELGLLAGVSHGPRGQAEAGMGIAVADFDANGRPDLVVTNYEGETQALYSQRSAWLFTDQRFVVGLAEPTLRPLAFGVVAADFDHDGDHDLAFANGHVRDNAEAFNPLSRYRQPNQVFENLTTVQGRLKFQEVVASGIDQVAPSRALSVADLDGDGDLDLLFSNVGGALEVYENLQPKPRQSAVALWPFPGDGRGWTVQVETSQVETSSGRQSQQVGSGGSYLSQSGPTVHFGLGTQPLRRVEVVVGDGSRRQLVSPPRGRRLIWNP